LNSGQKYNNNCPPKALNPKVLLKTCPMAGLEEPAKAIYGKTCRDRCRWAAALQRGKNRGFWLMDRPEPSIGRREPPNITKIVVVFRADEYV
jgi:hypothetical protein